MEITDIDDYLLSRKCDYKGRTYLVRDNGAVCRVPKEDGRLNKWDNIWTFGTKREDNGYMYLTGNVSIHQIVCTAFHGAPAAPQLIVDHIDTNRCNNRPENLRWATKLENALNNPATRKKIIFHCGSVEAFIENPAILQGKALSTDISWMRAVTKKEAETCRRNIERWAAIDSPPSNSGKGVGDYIFSDDDQDFVRSWNGGLLLPEQKTWAQQKAEIEAENQRRYEEEHSLKDSLTPGALQLNWVTPTEFPMCPSHPSENPLNAYSQNMKIGGVFCRNRYGESYLKDFGFNTEGDTIIVLNYQPGGVKEWYLCGIHFENGKYVHESIRSYFQEIGGRKDFTIYTGGIWTGGDVLDDFC